ncbi:unnamed protein product [Closterium sp. Yama58-4]|nr:unnamed protein product [Closterium sp. Yama58-4]
MCVRPSLLLPNLWIPSHLFLTCTLTPPSPARLVDFFPSHLPSLSPSFLALAGLISHNASPSPPSPLPLRLTWATSLTQDANLPLQSPLKVDRIPGGVRLSLQVTDSDTTKPIDILVTVEPPSADAPAMFRAVRSGPHCQLTPPGEPALMASMLTALRKSVALSRSSG